MKRFLVLVAVLAMLTTVAMAQDTETVNITATWGAGVSMTLDKTALTFTMAFPHNGDDDDIAANEGAINGHFVYAAEAGRHVAFSIMVTDATPEIELQPANWMSIIIQDSQDFPSGTFVPDTYGVDKVWWTSTEDTGDIDATFDVQLKNIVLPTGTYNTSLVFTFQDVL